MSRETEWPDDSSSRPPETTPASQTTHDTRAVEANVATEWKVGDVILDLYEVKGLLGEGGMGKVYRVHHSGWNIDLAVKTPRPEIITKAGGKESFVREAETWVNLGLHPHTVSCYYVRDLGGIPRVFAECIEGGSLSDWIRTRQLYEGGPEKALERILDVAIQFAWGLHYAHEQGLVHQDVKPANVMMTPEGLVKVTDFGLAKARGPADGNLTKDPGASIEVSAGGMTPAYCSPEQAIGSSLSRKTDIWSWGLSVLEMFTGDVTWMNGQAAAGALESYLDNGSDQPAIPTMTADIARVLASCFARNPVDRPATLAELAESLIEIYAGITGSEYMRPVPQQTDLLADELNNRGASLFDLGRRDEPIVLWSEALAVAPGHIEATYNAGFAAWDAGRITDEELVRQVAAANVQPDDSRAALLLALVHLARCDAPSAEAALFKFADTTNDADVLISLGDAYMARGAFSKAEKVYGDAVVRTNSRAAQGRLARARAHTPFSHELSGAPDGERLAPRCRRTFTLHSSHVSSVAFTPDGRRAVSASWDGSLRVFDVVTGRSPKPLRGHEDLLMSVAVSHDGLIALSASMDHTMRVWDLDSGRCSAVLTGHEGGVWSVAFLGKRHALSAGEDGTMRIWDLRDLSPVAVLRGHKNGVMAVAACHDERHAVTGSRDQTIALWNLATGARLRALRGHDGPVTSVSVSPDGVFCLSASHDATIRLWNLMSGECHAVLSGHAGMVHAVSFSPNGRLAISAGKDWSIRIWDVTTGLCVSELIGHQAPVSSVAFGPGGDVALSGSTDKTIRLWELARPVASRWSSPRLARPRASTAILAAQQRFQSHLEFARTALRAGDVSGALQSLDQARAVPGYERDLQALEIARSLSSRLLRRGLKAAWSSQTLAGHSAAVWTVRVLPDGKRLLSGSLDHTVMLWDIETGACVRRFEGHTNHVMGMGGADNRSAWSAGADATLRRWDFESGNCLRIVPVEGDFISAAAFSSDGRWALLGGARLRLIDLQSSSSPRSLDGHDGEITAVTFSSDGRLALSGGLDCSLRLWDLPSGRSLRVFQFHTGAVWCAALSPDGTHCLSGSKDQRLCLWNLEGAAPIRVLDGHREDVGCVDFAPDGRFALSGGFDETLRLWDLTTGDCLITMKAHGEDLTSVAFDGSGCRAVTGSLDKTIRMWEIDWALDPAEPTVVSD